MPLAEFHPLVVHFPIALLIAAFAFDLAALMFPRAHLTRAALYVTALAAAGAIAAYFSGHEAEESAERMPGIEVLLERHENLGLLVTIAASAMVLVRLGMAWRRWSDAAGGRLALVVLAGALAILVGVAGFTGGKLVYEHGAGVAPVMERLPAGGSADPD